MRTCPRCKETFSTTFIGCKQAGCPLRRPVDPNLGKTVGGRYRLISRLGSGGMSTVYLARHVLIERLVAVKTLRRELSHETIQRDRFLREARAVNRVNHDNIVEITDFGETEDGLVYLVMEYVPGDSLLSAMAGGAMPALAVLDIAFQVGSALARAHQMGVIHRDLKPENILLVQRQGALPQVKLLDFGIAKILDAPSLTGSQQIFGTPGYIAPEYISGNKLDGRSDLYSLGVILYEAATLALPFDYEYPGDLLVKHVTEPPVPLRQRRPEVDVNLEEFILRCLAKEPDQRFRDAYHFVEEVTRCRERIGRDDSWGSLGVVEEVRESVGDPAAGAEVSVEQTSRPAHDGVAPRFSEVTVIEGGAGVLPQEAPPAIAAVPPRGEAEVLPAPTVRGSAPFLKTLLGPAVVQPNDAQGLTSQPLRLEEFLDRTASFDTREDTEVERAAIHARRERHVTSGYERSAIPSEPNEVAVPLSVELPPGIEVSRTADSATERGLLGTRRWRERYTALFHAVEEIAAAQRVPAGIAECLTLSETALREIAERVEGAEGRQQEMEALSARARDVRAGFGAQQDRVARDLSAAGRKLAGIHTRFATLADEHERAAEAENRGVGQPGRALALRHAIRDMEEELGVTQRLCRTLEAELTGVHRELDTWSEVHEGELAMLAEVSSKELARLEELIEQLRGPLDRVEAFVRSVWGR